MRKEDLTTAGIIVEAIIVILGLVYMGLQIYYGIMFHVNPFTLVLNILVMLLVYVGLSVLSNYPEKINVIPAEICKGKIRKYSIRMIRLVKLIFVASLLVPCISDAMGNQMKEAYSLLVIGLIIVVTGYYEYRIIQLLKETKNKRK